MWALSSECIAYKADRSIAGKKTFVVPLEAGVSFVPAAIPTSPTATPSSDLSNSSTAPSSNGGPLGVLWIAVIVVIVALLLSSVLLLVLVMLHKCDPSSKSKESGCFQGRFAPMICSVRRRCHLKRHFRAYRVHERREQSTESQSASSDTRASKAPALPPTESRVVSKLLVAAPAPKTAHAALDDSMQPRSQEEEEESQKQAQAPGGATEVSLDKGKDIPNADFAVAINPARYTYKGILNIYTKFYMFSVSLVKKD